MSPGPKRTDLKHVLVIGSGPIVIGQACEFDYSGTQACRVLRSEGIRVSLVNSNPATIMTDPEFADATYVEPITPEFVEQVIARERPDALLATLGGQTANEDYTNRYIGKDSSLSDVSAISGATITSTAYEGCVKTAFEAFEICKEAGK